MKKSNIKCYIAGALNNTDPCEYIKNLHRMITYSDNVRQMGVSVYIPGNDILSGIVAGNYQYDDYFYNSIPFLKVCDCMFIVSGYQNSQGVKREVEIAKECKIPIFTEIEKLEAWLTQFEED